MKITKKDLEKFENLNYIKYNKNGITKELDITDIEKTI